MGLLSIDLFALLPVVVVVYHLLPVSARRHYLFLLSYAFYCTWSIAYAAMLLAVSVAIYAIGRRVERASSDGEKQRWVALAVVSLAAMLVGFKYAPAAVGAPAGFLIPLGVSYYTFKLISYVVDVYWEKVPAEHDLVAFLAYPVFFPQIVSGPIQRARDFLPQLKASSAADPAKIADGLRFILFGLFQKLVIADRLGLLASRVLDQPRDHTSVGLILASYAYAVQLYADFAGVTNLAIGIGLLFGIDAPPNFERPFYAPNIQEFWRRWHMTLTGWLTDYVFTPLRLALRNRGDVGLAVAITVNMVAIGAWHGASWSYVVFGAINAVFMLVSAFTLKRRNKYYKQHPRLAAIRRVTGPLLTFHLVVFAFIFLRAPTIRDGLYIASHLVPLDLLAAARDGHGPTTLLASLRGLGLSFDHIAWAVLALPFMELIELLRRSDRWKARFAAMPSWARWAGYYATTMAIVFLGVRETREFIYAGF